MTTVVFLIDPRHAGFVAGESAYLSDLRLSWRKTLVIVALLVLSLLLVGSQLVENSDVIDAEVVALYQEGDDFPAYYVVVAFEDRDVEAEIDWEDYRLLREGMQIEVRYEPGNLRLGGQTTEARLRRFFVGVVAAALLISSLIAVLFWLVLPDRVNRRLERNGVLVDGVVKSCWPLRSTRRVYEIQLRYVFESSAGEKIEDRLTRSRPDLRNQSLPEPGAPIKVLYVNRWLYRMM